MPWKRANVVDYSGVIFDAAARGRYVVFREGQSLSGWKAGAADIAWTRPLEGDELFGMKRVFALADAAVTLEVTGCDQPKRLLWVDPGQGDVVRSGSYSVEPSPGGFAALGDFVFLHGRNGGGTWVCLQVDARSGRLVSSGTAQSGRGLHASRRWLYLNAGRSGLFRTRPQALDWEHLEADKVTTLRISRDQMYFITAPAPGGEGWFVHWWDAAAGTENARLPLPVKRALSLVPASAPGFVAAYFDEEGLWMFDLSAATSRWNVAPGDGERIFAALSTPYGLAVAIKGADETSRIELRDERSGELRETVVSTRYQLSYLYWLGDHLIASGLDGLEFYV